MRDLRPLVCVSIVFALMTVLGARPAAACSCAMTNNCGVLAASDAVFEATVDRIDDGTTVTRTASGVELRLGSEHTIAYLKSFDGPATQTRLIGSISTVSAWKTFERELAPLAGRRVTIIGPRTLTVNTDVNGDFVVFDLPPGTYRVEPDIRQSAWYHPVQFTWQPADPYACEEANFVEPPDGKVSGTIIGEDGKPIANAFVYLHPADQPDAARRGEAGMGTAADDSGQFNFADLPPGKYVLDLDGERTRLTLGLDEALNVGPLMRRR